MDVSIMNSQMEDYAKRALVAEEKIKFLENIIANLPDVIFWKDIDSECLGCNNTLVDVFGVKNRSDVLGKTDFDFSWSSEEAHRVVNDDQEVMKTGLPKLNIYERVLLSDKNYMDFLTNKAPFYDAKNKIIGILGTATDITERKKIEAALKTAQEREAEIRRALMILAGSMAHDLRNPLIVSRMTANSMNKYFAKLVDGDCIEFVLSFHKNKDLK